jgi:hypothetical protein
MQESQQVNEHLASSLEPIPDPVNDAAPDSSNGTSNHLTPSDSTNKTDANRESESMSASPSATPISVQKSIDDRGSFIKVKSPTGAGELMDMVMTEPHASGTVDRELFTDATFGDPLSASATYSPSTSSFMRLAQRISARKREKHSPESIPFQAKRSKRRSWDRSFDSLSDAMSSLHLGSRWQSRRSSVDNQFLTHEGLAPPWEMMGQTHEIEAQEMPTERPSRRKQLSEMSSDSEWSGRFRGYTELGSISELEGDWSQRPTSPSRLRHSRSELPAPISIYDMEG